MTRETLHPSNLSTVVGSVHFFLGTAAPAGFLALTGQLVSRVTYPDLWTYAVASGNIAVSDVAWTNGQFSPGDGTTTFRLPDLRGEFIRGWDDGRGIDTGRALGTLQGDDNKPHNHIQGDGSYNAVETGRYGHASGLAAQMGWNSGSGFTTAFYTSTAGTTETRPRNVALLACVFTGV